MGADDSSLSLERSPRKLFVPSLAMANFATGPLGVLFALFLIDMASAFNVPVGVMGQLNTVLYVVALVFAVLTGVLSLRFRHKSLLLVGVTCLSVSALGCFLATSYNFILVAVSLSGVATALVFPMVTTLIGEHLVLEKRGYAMGWIIASGALAYVIGAPLMELVAGVGGWRFALLTFVIPVSALSFVLAFVGVPTTGLHKHGSSISKREYLRSFKIVLLNVSATACLIGNVLRTASFVAIVLYGISFFRQRFSVSTDSASAIILVAALCYTLGSLSAGKLVNRFGRKSLTVSMTLLAGVFIVSFVFMPDLWLSLALNFVGTWFSGMASSGANSLSLEQCPEFRGTMMSINSAAISIGNSVGSAIGGLMLVLFNYEAMGSALGIMGVLAGVIFYLLATDQSKK